MEVFARLSPAPGLCMTASGPVVLNLLEVDAKSVGIDHPFILHGVSTKVLHPALCDAGILCRPIKGV